jgi:hypothetical protein
MPFCVNPAAECYYFVTLLEPSLCNALFLNPAGIPAAQRPELGGRGCAGRPQEQRARHRVLQAVPALQQAERVWKGLQVRARCL